MLAGMLLASTGAFVPAAMAQQVPTAVPQEADDSGTIVVTARKRSEDILKTPVAVTALTADTIAAKGIVSINDIVQNTAGINVSNISSGRSDRSFQQIILRGFVPSTTTSTLVATFIDGVPVASATALNSVTDPERIEVLKGPQAAYFGRNTFAGAVNVVTKTPGNDLSGAFTGQWGTRNNQDFTGALEGAIVPDRLSVRVSGRYFKKDGSYRNNADPSQTLGDQRTITGSALVVAKPTDRLTVKLFGVYNQNDDGPSAQGLLSTYEVRSNNGVTNIPLLTGSNAGTIVVPSSANCTLNGFTAGLSATERRVSRPGICGAAPSLPAGFTPAQNTLEDGLLRNFLDSNGQYRAIPVKDGVKGYGLHSEYYHFHANVDYELGDTGLTLSSLTGYNNERYSQLADLDNYDSRLLRNPANPTGANPNLRPYWDFPFVVERRTKDFSQEGRLSYDKGPLKAILGASYLHTRSDSDLPSGNSVLVNGIPLGPTTRTAPQKSITKGIFGGVTYDLGNLSLSAEGRYQQDKIFAFVGGRATPLVFAANNVFGVEPGTYQPLEPFISRKFNKFLPRLIAQYDIDARTMVYASWSKGANISLSSFNSTFLAGSPAIAAGAASINLGVVVQPETLSNYEVGLKGRFFDNKVRTSISAYYGIWSNQQNNRSVLVNDVPAGYVTGTPCPQPYTCVAQVVSGVANSGKSIVKGIEAEVTILPFDGISIDLQGAVNDSTIRSFADPSISKLSGLIGGDFRGNQLAGSSKYSGNVGLQYGSDIHGFENTSFFVRGDLSYKSKIYADAANQAWVKGRTQVNFRVGLTRGPASIQAFLINAFNNRDYLSIANNTLLTPNFAVASTNSYLSVGLPELRTFGLKVGYSF